MTFPSRALRSLRSSARAPLRARTRVLAPAPTSSLIRTYAVPTPGPTTTPETIAYVMQFRQRARAAGYDTDATVRMMDAEVAAGRMPPEGPEGLRTLDRLHKLSIAFLVLVMGALVFVPVARHGRSLLGSVGGGGSGAGASAPAKREKIDYPRPRRLGDRDDSD
ncbi:unnamed protein product [Cutaneotrichosporon oleaginosum]